MGSTTLETPCREWQGGRNAHGYGMRQRKTAERFGTKYVHRQVWIMVNGPIPAGMVVRHRCDNPACFRYDHLELGTQADNIADAVARGRNSGPPSKTHCKNGHAFDVANTYVYAGSQYCRACRREHSRKARR